MSIREMAQRLTTVEGVMDLLTDKKAVDGDLVVVHESATAHDSRLSPWDVRNRFPDEPRNIPLHRIADLNAEVINSVVTPGIMGRRQDPRDREAGKVAAALYTRTDAEIAGIFKDVPHISMLDPLPIAAKPRAAWIKTHARTALEAGTISAAAILGEVKARPYDHRETALENDRKRLETDFGKVACGFAFGARHQGFAPDRRRKSGEGPVPHYVASVIWSRTLDQAKGARRSWDGYDEARAIWMNGVQPGVLAPEDQRYISDQPPTKAGKEQLDLVSDLRVEDLDLGRIPYLRARFEELGQADPGRVGSKTSAFGLGKGPSMSTPNSMITDLGRIVGDVAARRSAAKGRAAQNDWISAHLAGGIER